MFSAVLTRPAAVRRRPAVQAAFCIDLRSEVFRRAFEAQDTGSRRWASRASSGCPWPTGPQAHGPSTDEAQAHLPALLNPALTSTSHRGPKAEAALRIAARTRRAWGRFRQAAVSSFAFVEAAGPLYGAKLVKDALGLGAAARSAEPVPRIEGGLSAEQKARTAAAVLRAMSLTQG